MRPLFRRRPTDASIDEELRSHLALAIQERIHRGESPVEARRAALVEFGNLRATQEDVRSVWTWTALEQCVADVWSGCQILTRSPGISLTAIVLIALVIGGNTTIFSIVHGLLRKPAPAIAAKDLVSLGWSVNRHPVHPTDSFANYLDVASQARTVQPLLGFQFERFTFTILDGSYAVHGALVTPNYFDTLGLRLQRGRTFTEDEARGSALSVVISDRVWLEYFQRADDALGRTVVLNGHPATIVGVAPPGFQGVWLGERADVWLPIVAYAHVHGDARALDERSGGPVAMIGRLAAGSSLAEARSEMATIAARLQASYPSANSGKAITLFPYSATAAGDSPIARRGPQFLAIFAIVTALTLLIVSANVANLMLARAVVRQREMAVRRSFGASRLRVVRLVVAEGAVVSAGAWVLACGVASIISKTIPRLIAPAGEPGGSFALSFAPDWTVLGYAMLLAAFGTVAFTAGPALRTWRQDLLPFLKAGEQGIVQGRSRLATALVVLQLAFAVLLLASAGLAYRSLSLVEALDLGFARTNLLLVTIDPRGVPDSIRSTVVDRFRDRLMIVPGVDDAAYATAPPQEFWSTETVLTPGPTQPVVAERNGVGPGYLRVLGLSPRAGRELTREDRTRSVTSALINENLAAALWPGQTAIGRTMLIGRERRPVEVVGVTPNAFFSGFRRQERPFFVFVPMSIDPRAPTNTTFYIRYAGALDPVASAVSRALAEVEPRAPIVSMQPMETQLAGITSIVRVLTILLIVFAALSLFIATLGQYAVLAFTMKRRTRDFGVRMALGASARQILGSVVREGLSLTCAGLAIGSALGLLTGRALRSVLFGVTPSDPATYAGVAGVLAAASLIACYLPARRASRIDPMEALRQE